MFDDILGTTGTRGFEPHHLHQTLFFGDDLASTSGLVRRMENREMTDVISIIKLIANDDVYGDNVVFADFGRKNAAVAPMQMAA